MLIVFVYAPVTLYGPTFQRVRLTIITHVADPTTPRVPKYSRFGLFRFRSPLLSESRFLSFPPGTEMVHFPGFARARLCIQRAVPEVCSGGFPHSEIFG